MSDRRGFATPASEIHRERVEWLEPGIPLGATTLLVGDPGLGKSLLTHTLSASVSRAGGHALIATAEDSLSATVRPRLEAAQADLERVSFVEILSEGFPDGMRLPDDVDELERLAEEREATLVVIDPLMAHLPSEVNSWRDQSIRLALSPLRSMAERRRCAVVIVAHLNKSHSADPLRRAGGSVGLPGAARSALLLARDPDDENQRVLAHWKSNMSALAPSVLYGLEAILLPAMNGDPDVETVRLVNLGPSDHDGEALLTDRDASEERSALEEAMVFLRDERGGGRQVATKTVQKHACEAGIALRTLDRAKAKLRVKAEKHGFEGVWVWSLSEERQRLEGCQPQAEKPHESTKGAKGAYMGDVAALDAEELDWR